MEHNFPFNNQLINKTTVRAVKNERIKMLEGDLDENNEKLDEITREDNRVKTHT